jgi:urease accessory protein
VALVQVEPAVEALLVVRAGSPLELLQAAYHLGNRHVALELGAEELRLLADPVLEQLLRHRGLEVGRVEEAFRPESGAYGHVPHSHGHP